MFLLVFQCYQRVRGDSRRWRSLIKPGRDLLPAVWRSVAATAPRASTPSWSCTWNTHSKVQPLCVSSIIIKYTVTTAILRSLMDWLQSYRSAAGWWRSVIKVKAKERLIVFLVFGSFHFPLLCFQLQEDTSPQFTVMEVLNNHRNMEKTWMSCLSCVMIN